MKYLLAIILLTSCQQFKTVDICVDSISAKVLSYELRICELKTQAGAIGSLTWNGMEFIDPTEHGASLQSAISYNNLGEFLNPTEAGSKWDGPADTNSTSVLLSHNATATSMSTSVQAALWDQPFTVSGTKINKQVTIGYQGFSNVIQYDVQFDIGNDYELSTVEALTGYMPTKFTRYFLQNKNTNVTIELAPLEVTDKIDGDMQALITTDESTRHALALLTITKGAILSTWGQMSFNVANPNTKWNAAWYLVGVPKGIYSYKMLLVIGSLPEVKDTIKRLK